MDRTEEMEQFEEKILVNEHVTKETWAMNKFLTREEDLESLQAEDELIDMK